MKRRVIVVAGIIAFVCFVLYQFIFADHRSRLRVDTSKGASIESLSSPEHVSFEEDAVDELTVLGQEAVFNESIRERVSLDKLAKVIDLADAAKERRQVKSSVNRMLIKEGFIDFQVDDVIATKKSIDDLLKQFGGYTASAKEENYSGGPQYQAVVRIPADQLDAFIARIDPLAKKMRSKHLSTKDVTDEYIDLTERLVTKRELESNYREILRKARRVSEMLEVEEQLQNVRGEIESMEGRIEYINSRVSYSILTITYFQQITNTDEPTFGAKIATSLASGWINILDFIVDLLYAWPLLIVLPLAAWFGVKLFKRFKHIVT